jgi:hypothetical protein
MTMGRIFRHNLFQILLCLLIGIITVVSAYFNRNDGVVSLVFDGSDIYMDAINTIFDSCRQDLYANQGNVYPPALTFFFRALFRAFCEAGFLNAKNLRAELLPYMMLTHFFMIFSVGYILGTVVFKLQRSIIIAFAASIVGSFWPPLIFGLDRMNLILVPFFLFIFSFYLPISILHKGNEKLALWNISIFISVLAGTLFKPYFLVQYGLLFILDFFGRHRLNVKRSIVAFKYLFGLLFVFFVNYFPFVSGNFTGGISNWLRNLSIFQGSVSVNSSHVWNMSYSSLSIFSASRIMPASNMPDFLNQPLTGSNIVLMVFCLSTQLIFTFYICLCFAKLIHLKLFLRVAHPQSISIILELSIVVLSIVIMSSLFASFGYYTGIFWVIVVTIALSLGSRQECVLITILSLVFMAFSASGTFLWPSSSIPSIAFLYILTAFSCSILVRRIVASSNLYTRQLA